MISFSIVPEKPFHKLELVYDNKTHVQSFASHTTALTAAYSTVSSYLLKQFELFLQEVDTLSITGIYYVTPKRKQSIQVLKSLLDHLSLGNNADIRYIADEILFKKEYFQNLCPTSAKHDGFTRLTILLFDIIEVTEKILSKPVV